MTTRPPYPPWNPMPPVPARPAIDVSRSVPESAPKGHVEPRDPDLLRAHKALRGGRWADALRIVDEVPEPAEGANPWRRYLLGMVAGQRQRFDESERFFMQAATWALLEARDTDDVDGRELLRLAAWALHRCGSNRAHRDEPEEAYRLHLQAFELRARYGSVEEQCESAISLGLDADLARQYETAHVWHRRAIEFGAVVAEDRGGRLARAWQNLSASLADSENHDGAVEAARAAADLWRQADPGCIDTARADATLARRLLAQAETRFETDMAAARAMAEAALRLAEASREALLAFGDEGALDAAWCLEQIDFAQRLLATLPAESQGPEAAD